MVNVRGMITAAVAALLMAFPAVVSTQAAGPRTDYFGPGDSGATYDFYLDYMYPKGTRPGSNRDVTGVTVETLPRTDYFGPGDSGAAYDFYLDYMYPKGTRPGNDRDVTGVTVETLPRTDYFGPGDSGATYDFYLDYMYPKGRSSS